MNKQLRLIYITGLGDQKVTFQKKAVSIWHWWGVEAELYQMNWADKEPWERKFKRLLGRIDDLTAEDKDVGLVAISAGATAAINVFAVRKDAIVGVVLIAGKVNRPEAIHEGHNRNNPAFVTSAHECLKALATLSSADRKRILSRYAIADELVKKPDSFIPSARNRLSPTIGHMLTIALQITLGAPSFIRFLKRLHPKH